MRFSWQSITVFSTLSRLRHPVLDYSGEHNIPITTNPYGFFLLFPCYLLLRACSLTLDIALPKICSPKGEGTKDVRFAQTTPSLGGGCRRRERVLLNFTISIFQNYPHPKIFYIYLWLEPSPENLSFAKLNLIKRKIKKEEVASSFLLDFSLKI